MAHIGPDHPKVKAKVAQKKAAARKKQDELIAVAFDGPKKIGKHTFYPLNMQGVMALRQPAILNQSLEMLSYVIGYILTVEPSKRIAEGSDPAALMAKACDFWENEIDSGILEQVAPLVNVSKEIAFEGPDFFFRKGKKSPTNS